jgi:imidazolonepropionase-like amidohydrolase
VHRIKAAGIDFVKVYSTLPADLYFAIAEEAKQLKIPFAGHVPIVVDAGDAAQAGQKSMEHLNELLESGCTRLAEELRLVTWHEWTDAHMELALNNYDELRCQRLFSLFIKNGTVHIPTLVNEFIKQLSAQEIEGVFQDPLFGEVPDVERQVWSQAAILRTKLSPTSLALRKRAFQAKLRLVRAMHDAGVTLMAGTDLGNEFLYPGSSLIEELELFVQAGLTPMEAIKAATITPATFAHMADSLGSITPGKLADLVVLDADPLQNISNLRRVHCVVLNGKIVQKGENKR